MKPKYSLLDYSLTAAAFLHAAAVNSQAVFTDINPDVILDEPGELFGIDLDEDGLNDFNFINKSFTTTVFYDDIANVKAIFVGAFDTMQNGIVGSTGYISGGGGYNYYKPYAISNNDLINGSDNFYNLNYQTLVAIAARLEWPYIVSPQGNWYPWFGDVTNKFIGFKYEDEEENLRYGWIRCSVIDSGRTLIIHDYAYESKPNVGILAGDTVGDIIDEINEHQYLSGATIYSFNQNVFIQLEDFEEVECSIYNIQGQLISNQNLTNKNTIIDLKGNPIGIYIVALKNTTKRYSKTIMII